MKKIAFLTNGFTGSIMPLVKRLVNRGYFVDLYMILYKTQNCNELEALEQTQTCLHYGRNLIECDKIKGLPNEINNNNFHLFIICNVGNGGSSWMKQKISGLLRHLIKKRLCQYILNQKYTYINIIGHDADLIDYDKRLIKHKIFHTFHEVYNHASKKHELLSSVNAITKLSIPIIVPSEHLKKFIISHFPDYNVIHIPFGIFENYINFKPDRNTLSLPSKYLLFLGNVLPYKGLDLLFDAFCIIKSQNKDINIVIAGNGKSELLDKLYSMPGITIINRWITNNELAELIIRSNGVVCPYLSASQSGLPSTAYVFKKKVIATNVGAMSEYIKEKGSGFLITLNDSRSLANSMLYLYNNNEYIEDVNNIQTILGHDWDTISNTYMKFLDTL